MSRRFGSTIACAAVGALLAACTGGQGELTAPAGSAVTTQATTTTASTDAAPTTVAKTTTRPTTTTTEATTTTTIEPAVLALESLTLEEKVGQLLMPVIVGTSVNDSGSAGTGSPGDLVSTWHLGGVIYLGTNIAGAEQLTALSSGLQERAVADSGIGLLISADQEGGRVVRVRDGVTVLPSARSYEGNAAAAAADATTSGTGLLQQGINMVLAPVADVTDSTTSVIGNRSYSGDSVVASAMVGAVVDGYQAAGVASAVKHWPGHGSTDVDSHQSLPTLGITIEQWETVDRPVFIAALDAGVDAVMIGHLAFPALDPSGEPATVSPVIVQEQLRDLLGFDGVVMTDALDMGAVRDLGPGELSVRAVAAGVDLLLAPLDVEQSVSALLGAVENGTLTEERIDQSVLRLLRLKAALGLPIGAAAAPADPELAGNGVAESEAGE